VGALGEAGAVIESSGVRAKRQKDKKTKNFLAYDKLLTYHANRRGIVLKQTMPNKSVRR
jgi:hypothetical protein